MQKLFLEIIFY